MIILSFIIRTYFENCFEIGILIGYYKKEGEIPIAVLKEESNVDRIQHSI
jgi:hypothetical protein